MVLEFGQVLEIFHWWHCLEVLNATAIVTSLWIFVLCTGLVPRDNMDGCCPLVSDFCKFGWPCSCFSWVNMFGSFLVILFENSGAPINCFNFSWGEIVNKSQICVVFIKISTNQWSFDSSCYVERYCFHSILLPSL